MRMNMNDITMAFCDTVSLLCAAGADAGHVDEMRELTAALDDLAAYCSAETSRAMRVEEIGGRLELPEPDSKWWGRCSDGRDKAQGRLVKAVNALLITDACDAPVSCLVDGEFSIQEVDCPRCGDSMAALTDELLMACACGVEGALSVELRLMAVNGEQSP